MPYCHKCGSEISESMTFCSQCGAALKVKDSGTPVQTEYYRSEKSEKNEKQEKQEKEEKMEKDEQNEKYEKHEYSILGPLVGGVILILVGFLSYLAVSGFINVSSIWPFILIVIGAIVILGVAAGAVMARGKNPRP
ncbi:MAG: zinc-ribbon domain-containing protein [Candidatus Bathyarchaeota archaeon]|nr:zinc-ribbon domain-containing protein [Candidatus Bathyarchaeum sp.]